MLYSYTGNTVRLVTVASKVTSCQEFERQRCFLTALLHVAAKLIKRIHFTGKKEDPSARFLRYDVFHSYADNPLKIPIKWPLRLRDILIQCYLWSRSVGTCNHGLHPVNSDYAVPPGLVEKYLLIDRPLLRELPQKQLHIRDELFV